MEERKRIIGRREHISIPEINAFAIEAKIDTGAFRTALHCESCKEVEIAGKKILEATFQFGEIAEIFHFEQFRLRVIKNSFGQKEERYCVPLRLYISGKIIRSDVSLTNRSDMKYPALIGRKTIGKKFLIDVSKVHTVRAKRKKN